MACPPSPRVIEPMLPSISANNVITVTSSPISTPIKRKADNEECQTASKAGGKENGGIDKRPRLESNATGSTSELVELKKGKLVFKQAAHVFDLPRRPRNAFENFLLDAEESKEVINAVPESLRAPIVFAGNELSSSTDTLLIPHIKKALDLKNLADLIPLPLWTTLISELFSLTQYGFQPHDFPSSSTGPRKIPAGLQIRCWEVKEPEKWFSDEQLAVLRSRRAERARAREEVLGLFAGMDDIEKMELLKGEKEKAEKAEKGERDQAESAKKVKKAAAQDSPAVSIGRKSREGTAGSAISHRSASPVKKSKMTPEEEEAARLKKEEREAKKAAAEEKKQQKAELANAKKLEEQKAQAAKDKQRQAMSSFFMKPTIKPKSAMSLVAGPSKPKVKSEFSDFDRTFKPVSQRPNVDWAPVNKFRYKRRSLSPIDAGEDANHELWEAKDFLADHNRRSRHAPSRRKRLPHGLRSSPMYGSVAEVWAEYQESDDPRKVLAQLRNSRKFPWKTLAFDGQVRPPYSGTFTKRSVVVGPRTPLAQDPMFDYSYDSGDDWQDDEGGEDVDDNENLPPDEQNEESDEEEGEFDDWLDDSEDVNFAPSVASIDDDDAPVLVGGVGGVQTRLPMKQVVKKRDAPKKVVKIVPSWKGPMWEVKIGSGTEGMEDYTIQLLNDTPSRIDPFTYTSSDTVAGFKTTFSTTVVGANLSVKTLLLAEVVERAQPPPQIPNNTSSTSCNPPAVPSLTDSENSTAASTAPKSKPAGPKVAFPISHLPELLRMIDGNTRIRTDLISQLKAHFDTVASKAAIEQKLKEVAVREGKSKDSAWRVLPDAWQSAGVTPPVVIQHAPMAIQD